MARYFPGMHLDIGEDDSSLDAICDVCGLVQAVSLPVTRERLEDVHDRHLREEHIGKGQAVVDRALAATRAEAP